jgi:hypothetical protein
MIGQNIVRIISVVAMIMERTSFVLNKERPADYSGSGGKEDHRSRQIVSSRME